MDLTEAIHKAADEAIPKINITYNHKDHWFYCERVKELKSRLNRARKVLKRRPTNENKAQLREIATHVNREMAEIKTQKWLEWCAELNQHTSIKDLWKQIHKITGKKPEDLLQTNYLSSP